MLFGKAEIDNVNLTILPIKHKVWGFDISMDETTFVHFFDCNHHFDQNLDGNLQVVPLLQAPSGLSQIDAEQVHDDEVLLAI